MDGSELKDIPDENIAFVFRSEGSDDSNEDTAYLPEEYYIGVIKPEHESDNFIIAERISSLVKTLFYLKIKNPNVKFYTGDFGYLRCDRFPLKGMGDADGWYTKSLDKNELKDLEIIVHEIEDAPRTICISYTWK